MKKDRILYVSQEITPYLPETDMSHISRHLPQGIQEKGNEIILIPIATNNDLVSLDALLENYEISKYPVVIIDQEHVIEEVSSVEDLINYLD